MTGLELQERASWYTTGRAAENQAVVYKKEYPMVLDYAVTFEFELEAPLTARGKVSALEVQTCASRALVEAKNKFPKTQWSSIVVVLTREGLLDAVVRKDEVSSNV